MNIDGGDTILSHEERARKALSEWPSLDYEIGGVAYAVLLASIQEQFQEVESVAYERAEAIYDELVADLETVEEFLMGDKESVAHAYLEYSEKIRSLKEGE